MQGNFSMIQFRIGYIELLVKASYIKNKERKIYSKEYNFSK